MVSLTLQYMEAQSRRKPTNLIPEFFVRTGTNAIEEYCCKLCTKARNGLEKWFTSKSYIRLHANSGEHKNSLARLEELELQRKTLAFEAEQEAARVNVLNSIRPRATPEGLSGPDITCRNRFSKSLVELMEDITFSAGSETLDHIETVPSTFEPQFWPEESGIANDPEWEPYGLKSNALSVWIEMKRGQYG